MKKKVLIFAPYYVPSIKGGGPIISTKNLVENLFHEIDFYIVTSDRDLGDSEAFKTIETDNWVKVGNAQVIYIDRNTLDFKKTKKIMCSEKFDYYYLNSFFDYKFSIQPLLIKKFGKLRMGQMIVAPRGEFSKGALQLKKLKKKAYINFFKGLGIQKDIIWHATAEEEKKDINRVLGENLNIKIARNLTENYNNFVYQKKIDKEENSARFVFLSRIHPKKNLLQALEFFKQIAGNVTFSIFGPIEDKAYWEKCLNLIEELPPNINVQYNGIIIHSEILDMFNDYHFFLFPTLGENYGHVISEALLGGCPVIISDRTPWKKLKAAKAGWDIPLEKEEKYISILQYCVDMKAEEYKTYSESAFNFGKKMSNKSEDVEAALELFQE